MSTYCTPGMISAHFQIHYLIYSLQQLYKQGIIASPYTSEETEPQRLLSDISKITASVYFIFKNNNMYNNKV